MGSDPQSHLEEQNFLIVGNRKIRPEDWVRVAYVLDSIHAGIFRLAHSSGAMPESSAVLLDVLVTRIAGLKLEMLADTGRPPAVPPIASGKHPRTPIEIEWAELHRKLQNVETTLSFSTAEARQRQELFRNLLDNVNHLEQRLKDKGLL